MILQASETLFVGSLSGSAISVIKARSVCPSQNCISTGAPVAVNRLGPHRAQPPGSITPISCKARSSASPDFPCRRKYQHQSMSLREGMAGAKLNIFLLILVHLLVSLTMARRGQRRADTHYPSRIAPVSGRSRRTTILRAAKTTRLQTFTVY